MVYIPTVTRENQKLRCLKTPCTTLNTNKNFVVNLQALFLQSQNKNSSLNIEAKASKKRK